MQEKIEKLVKIVYKKWKSEGPQIERPHPDEETFACFLEDRLPEEERKGIIRHLLECQRCAEVLEMQLRIKFPEDKDVPPELLGEVRRVIQQQMPGQILEIILRLKEKALEILSTTGDVLVGQEFVPASILRSRSIKDFKDQITILKDFKDIRVEVKIENKPGKMFSLTVVAKEKETQKALKDLRITLLKDDVELESYLTDSGKVAFEDILLGKYTVQISDIKDKLASVLIDIKI